MTYLNSLSGSMPRECARAVLMERTDRMINDLDPSTLFAAAARRALVALSVGDIRAARKAIAWCEAFARSKAA